MNGKNAFIILFSLVFITLVVDAKEKEQNPNFI